MELQQINPVRLKPAQGLINLLCRSVFGAAVDLGHQEHLLPVAVPQRFAQPAFARAVVIVPAVVHKVDPVVDGGANDADTLLLVGLLAEVIAAQAHHGDLLSSASHGAVRYPAFGLDGPRRVANPSDTGGCDSHVQELSPCHHRILPALPGFSTWAPVDPCCSGCVSQFGVLSAHTSSFPSQHVWCEVPTVIGSYLWPFVPSGLYLSVPPHIQPPIAQAPRPTRAAATPPLSMFRAHAVPDPARSPHGVLQQARRGRRRVQRGAAARAAPGDRVNKLWQVPAYRHGGGPERRWGSPRAHHNVRTAHSRA